MSSLPPPPPPPQYGGATPSPPLLPGYASLGQRIRAYLLDGVFAMIAVIIGLAIGWGLSAVLWGAGAYELATVLFVLTYVFAGITYAIYAWYLVATKGYSPGKKVLGLRVVDQDTGQPIGWGRAFLRNLILGWLAWLIVFFINSNPRRQGWHDNVARSVVLTADSVGASPAPPATAPAPAVKAAASPPPPPVGLATNRNTPPPPPPPPPAPPVAATPPPPPPPAPPVAATPPPPPPPPPPVAATPPPPPPPPPPVAATPPPPPPPPAPPAPVVEVSPPPPPPPVVPPPAAGLIPPPPAPFEDSDEIDTSTRISARRKTPADRWQLRGDDASIIGLRDVVLVGRDPDAGQHEGAVAVAISDPERSISKTHALFIVVDGALFVEDWNSTNGVFVTRDGAETELTARERHELRAADRVALGDRVFVVEEIG